MSRKYATPKGVFKDQYRALDAAKDAFRNAVEVDDISSVPTGEVDGRETFAQVVARGGDVQQHLTDELFLRAGYAVNVESRDGGYHAAITGQDGIVAEADFAATDRAGLELFGVASAPWSKCRIITA